jgi:hypothetical protein
MTRSPDFLPHPGVPHLLKTKTKPHFDRTVTDRSKSLFGLVWTSNLVVSSWLSIIAYLQLLIAQPTDEYTANRLSRVTQLSENVKRIRGKVIVTPAPIFVWFGWKPGVSRWVEMAPGCVVWNLPCTCGTAAPGCAAFTKPFTGEGAGATCVWDVVNSEHP